jgi:hypothetical protein
MLDRIGIVDAVDRKPQQCRCSATSGMGAVLYRLGVPMSPFRHGMVRWEGRGPVVASIRIRLVWIFCGALDAREFGAGPSGQDREQPLTTRDFVKRDMLKVA